MLQEAQSEHNMATFEVRMVHNVSLIDWCLNKFWISFVLGYASLHNVLRELYSLFHGWLSNKQGKQTPKYSAGFSVEFWYKFI